MRIARAFTMIVLIGVSFASSGDRSSDFQNCVQHCESNRCHFSTPPALPLALQLTRWTCTDDCKYSCMHDLTDRDLKKGVVVQQFYGKWPFWRLVGMQEPASVAFSLLNLWAHARGASKVRKRMHKDHPMKSYYLVWAFTSINAWIWSSMFHTRDLPFTEKMDYFSAALAILYALYYTVIRLFHLYPKQSYRLTSSSVKPRSGGLLRFWTLLCIIAYVAHVSYLSLLPRFDYTYNMAFNLALGLTHNALWLIYGLPISLIRRFPAKPKSYRPSFVGKATIFVALTTGATALELFDFPPWGRVIDAHALWHLSTAPIALLWYGFLLDDSLDLGWGVQRV